MLIVYSLLFFLAALSINDLEPVYGRPLKISHIYSTTRKLEGRLNECQIPINATNEYIDLVIKQTALLSMYISNMHTDIRMIKDDAMEMQFNLRYTRMQPIAIKFLVEILYAILEIDNQMESYYSDKESDDKLDTKLKLQVTFNAWFRFVRLVYHENGAIPVRLCTWFKTLSHNTRNATNRLKQGHTVLLLSNHTLLFNHTFQVQITEKVLLMLELCIVIERLTFMLVDTLKISIHQEKSLELKSLEFLNGVVYVERFLKMTHSQGTSEGMIAQFDLFMNNMASLVVELRDL